MKFSSFPHQKRGSVLMITVATTAVMGIMLIAYLSLTNAQTTAVARSQAWNSAIPVLEAGIEEALAHLNQNGATNLAVDGWTQVGAVYTKFRAVGDAQAFMTISNASTSPVIYAHGFALIPYLKSNYVERVVRVTTFRDGLFRKGILSRGQITLNGTGFIDSYDSSNPLYSTNGRYVLSKRRANGGVASNTGLTNIISTGNTFIYGDLATGPGGSADIGPNGKVGDLAWMSVSANKGIQPGKLRDDMNVAFPDVASPFGSAPLPAGGSGWQYILDSSGNWEIPSLTGRLLVRSNVNAVLLVDGNINLTGGSDVIQIDSGGSLQLYMNGATAKIAGNGVANNNTYATNFIYWGRPGNTSLTVDGNGTFVGLVYAPSADFTLRGGGSDAILESFIGSAVSKTVTFSGNFAFHYDEILANLANGQRYTANGWDEL